MKDVKQIFSQNITKINVKTSSFLEVSKINTYISSIEKEIEEKKRELAELICGRWETDRCFPEEEMTAILESIMQSKALIEEQKQMIAEIEENQKKILGVSQKSLLSAGADGEPKEVVYCTECGAPCPKTSNFCRQCGNRLNV